MYLSPLKLDNFKHTAKNPVKRINNKKKFNRKLNKKIKSTRSRINEYNIIRITERQLTRTNKWL